MHEALGLAEWITHQMNLLVLRDEGAQYAVTVTDTAGNVAEVQWSEEQRQWIWDEGADTARLLMRLRLNDGKETTT